MRKRPRFEQVPLKVVKKVVQEQVQQQETESGRETKKKELEQLEQVLLLARNGKSEKQKKHDS